jgi:flavin reductase (DIM6/NTAB) family NADH-FMN oxidoreductase RutF
VSVPLDPDRLRVAMRRIAASVGILATDGTAGRAGLTVSSFCSLSLEPPSLLCAVHGRSRALETLMTNGVFTANFLSEGQSRVADVFAGRVAELRDLRFSAGEWDTMVTGAPALVDAVCTFDCRIAATFEFGTHRIVAGEIVTFRIGPRRPLLYYERGYQRLAEDGPATT